MLSSKHTVHHLHHTELIIITAKIIKKLELHMKHLLRDKEFQLQNRDTMHRSPR